MKALRSVCIVAVLLEFICTLSFSIRPRDGLQFVGTFLALALLGLLLGAFVFGIVEACSHGLRAFIPALICLIGLPVAVMGSAYLGHSIRDWRFKRNLPRYMEIARMVERGEIRTRSSFYTIALPDGYADLAEVVHARTNSAGRADIAFIIGGGFPAKHSGYFYFGSGTNGAAPKLTDSWPYCSEIAPAWFRISN